MTTVLCRHLAWQVKPNCGRAKRICAINQRLSRFPDPRKLRSIWGESKIHRRNRCIPYTSASFVVNYLLFSPIKSLQVSNWKPAKAFSRIDTSSLAGREISLFDILRHNMTPKDLLNVQPDCFSLFDLSHNWFLTFRRRCCPWFVTLWHVIVLNPTFNCYELLSFLLRITE